MVDKIDELYKYIPIELSLDGIIGFALRSEYDSYRFYKAAENAVSDTAGKELLKQLANAERAHVDALQEAFRQYFPEAHTEAVRRIKDGTVGYLSVEKNLLGLAKMGVVEIISIAIWEERKAKELYETALAEADDKEMRKLLKSLVKMGEEHIDILTRYRDKYIEEG
ncbi:MAG: hypothetical protein Kow0090_22540 [Myxococcota bacterium]